jgi:hypothetical protein
MVFWEGSHGTRKTTSNDAHYDLFFGHQDPRIERNKLYPLYEVIVIAILAVIALAQGREDIERYAKAKRAWLSRFLKLEHGIPHHDVYRRVISRIAPEEIEQCFMNWVRAIKREYEREVAD